MNIRYLAKTLGHKSALVLLDLPVLVDIPLEDESIAKNSTAFGVVYHFEDPAREVSPKGVSHGTSPLGPF